MAINAAHESTVEEIPSYHEAEEDATRAVSVAVISVDESIEAEPQYLQPHQGVTGRRSMLRT